MSGFFQRVMQAVAIVAASVGLAAPTAWAADGVGDPSGRRGVSVTIVEPSAFDWSDAGVGAAGTFGLLALAAGVVIVARHQRG